MCDGKSYEINILEKPSDNIIVTTDLLISAGSANTLVIKPNAEISFKPTDNTYWSNVSLRNGIMSLKVIIGTDYDIKASFGTYTFYAKLKVENESNNSLKITIIPTETLGSRPKTDQAKTYITTKPLDKNVSVTYNIVVTDEDFNKIKN